MPRLPALLLALGLPTLLFAQGPLVINEIMYHPDSDVYAASREYVEVTNISAAPLNVSGWYFYTGIDYTFPPGTIIPAGGFLVVAKDVEEATRFYQISNVVGPFGGQLADGGERIGIADATGNLLDSVRYDDRGGWPVAPDGQGPSLECLNPYVDNDDPANWRAANGAGGVQPWQYVTINGTGTQTSGRSSIYFYLSGAGECLIDNIEVVRVGDPLETNHVLWGDFEDEDVVIGDATGWRATGNHSQSKLSNNAFFGAQCAHIIATGAGGSDDDSFQQYNMAVSVQVGQPYQVRFWVRFLTSGVSLTARFTGSGVNGSVSAPGGALYSPGRSNNRLLGNLPPFIDQVGTVPECPLPSEDCAVVARLRDSDGIRYATVEYSLVNGTGSGRLPMRDDGLSGDGVAGDGVYGAFLPRQANEKIVRYVVWAEDMLGNLQIWPEPSEPTPNGAYFTWDRTPATPLRHIWLHSTYNQVTWTTNSIGSDLPATIVIEGKVYDRVRVRHRGNTALGNYKKNFKFRFNKDNRPGDKKTWNLNGDMCDKSYMHAVVSWEITRRMGLPYCETESIHFRLTSGSSPFRFWGLYTYIEQPNEQFLERNGLDPTGNFYKSSSDQRALATYPGPYRKNSNEEANDWTDLEFFIEGFNVYYNSPPAFTAVSKQQAHDFLLQYADVDQIIDYLSSMTLIGNADQCGKNQLLYHDPATNRWKKIGWDLDLTLGQNYDPTAGSTFGYRLFNNLFKIDNSILLGCRLFPKNDGPWNKLDDRFMAPANDDAYAVPFRGAYLLRVRHWLDTMYTPENLHPFIDSYKAMIASDAALDAARWPGEPRADRAGSDWILPGDFDVWVQRIKDFITQRRANLYTQIAGFSDLPTPTPTPTATPTRTPTPTPPQAPPPRWFTPDVVALPANSGYHSGLLRLSDYVSDDTTAPQNIIFSLVSQSNPSVALVSVSSSGLLSVSVFANKVGVTRVVVRARDQDFATADTTIEIVVSGGATGVPPGQWRSLR